MNRLIITLAGSSIIPIDEIYMQVYNEKHNEVCGFKVVSMQTQNKLNSFAYAKSYIKRHFPELVENDKLKIDEIRLRPQTVWLCCKEDFCKGHKSITYMDEYDEFDKELFWRFFLNQEYIDYEYVRD